MYLCGFSQIPCEDSGKQWLKHEHESSLNPPWKKMLVTEVQLASSVNTLPQKWGQLRRSAWIDTSIHTRWLQGFVVTPGLRGRPILPNFAKFAIHGALRSLRGFVVAHWASWSPKICNTWSFEITPGLRGRPWALRSPKLTSHGALRSLWGFVVARICNTWSFEITPGLRGCPWALWLPIISPKICYKTIKQLWILVLKS